MKKYYSLSKISKPGIAFACTEGPTPIAHDLIPQMRNRKVTPFTLLLKKPIPDKSGIDFADDLSGLKALWLDYQPNNLAWPLMSEKMKGIFERELSGNEGIVWMETAIHSDYGNKVYYIPRFEKELDVLDQEKTLFVKGTNHVIQPVFSLEKISNLSLFYLPGPFWEITPSIYVNDRIRLQVEEEQLSGVVFENVKIQ